MRQKDEADEIAERLFDMVRDALDDQKVIDAIAEELRKAAQGPRKWGVLRTAPRRFDEEKPPAGHHAPAPEESEGT